MPSVTLPDLFQTRAAFSAAFLAGLERQLPSPNLGAFILVLANAGYDAELWPQLAGRLEARFQAWQAHIRTALREGRALDVPEDDLMVFLKLMAMGFEAIQPTESRRVGPWAVQFNGLRALRPARASGLKVEDCRAPAFHPQGFHFNKPFLTPEILWEGRLLSHDARLLFNKFPFAPLHALLVPEPGQQRPQQLDQDMHEYAWHLASTLGAGLPGLLLAYNSYGAQASVNQLHLQTALQASPLPVEHPVWRHNGGREDYPLAVEVFTSARDAWFAIERLHQAGTPYNLLYRPGRLTLMPRAVQGRHALPPWSSGVAWLEAAGGVTCFRRDDFSTLDADALASELARWATA